MTNAERILLYSKDIYSLSLFLKHLLLFGLVFFTFLVYLWHDNSDDPEDFIPAPSSFDMSFIYAENRHSNVYACGLAA